jgi:hypothetical protein
MGSAGQLRADVEELSYAGSSYRSSTSPGAHGGMTYSDVREIYLRIKRVHSQRALPIPEVVLAKIESYFGNTTLLWGDIQHAAPLILHAAPILRAATESPFERAILAAFEGHIAMYQGRHDTADRHFREYATALQYEFRERAWESEGPHLYIVANLSMAGRFDEAKAVAGAALDGRKVRDRDSQVDSGTNDLRGVMAQVLLESGDAQGALAAMPRASNPLHQLFPFSNHSYLRGQILCALGRRAEGLELILANVREYTQRDIYPHDADIARARAVAGLCAVAQGQRALAQQLAAQARTSLAMQPDISPYHRAPSIELDAMLSRKASIRRGEPSTIR